MTNIRSALKQAFIINQLLLFFCFSLSAHAKNSIKVNTYTDYPPYLYHEKGHQSGLYMRIIDLTLKAIEQPYSIHTLPFKRGILRTESGEGIMIGILKTDKRMLTMDFSEPFYQEKVSIYFNHQQRPLIKTVDKLDGLKIGTLLGWSYGVVFDKAKADDRFYTIDNKLETNFHLLAKGRLDAVVHSELSAVYILNKLSLKNKIFLASEPLALANVHIAVKKGTQKELLVKINQKLNESAHIKKIDTLIKNYQK